LYRLDTVDGILGMVTRLIMDIGVVMGMNIDALDCEEDYYK